MNPQIAKLIGLEIIAYKEAIDVIVNGDPDQPISPELISRYWRLETNLPAYPTLIIGNRLVEEILALVDVLDLEELLRTYGFSSIDD